MGGVRESDAWVPAGDGPEAVARDRHALGANQVLSFAPRPPLLSSSLFRWGLAGKEKHPEDPSREQSTRVVRRSSGCWSRRY